MALKRENDEKSIFCDLYGNESNMYADVWGVCEFVCVYRNYLIFSNLELQMFSESGNILEFQMYPDCQQHKYTENHGAQEKHYQDKNSYNFCCTKIKRQSIRYARDCSLPHPTHVG